MPEKTLTDVFTDIGNAIRSKTGKSNLIAPVDMADEISGIQTGSKIVPGPNDNVIVYDYDGTVLDAQQVAVGESYRFPSFPQHNGLSPVEYAVSCERRGGRVQIPPSKQVRIGLVYETTSDKVEIVIHAPKNIPIVLDSSWTNVDWGDGTITTNSNTHTYAVEGDYTIKVSNVTEITSDFITNKNVVKSVRLSENVTTIGQQAFYNCYSLESIVISESVTTIGLGAFYGCCSLKFVVIPDSITTIGQNAFASCYSLTSVVIPNTVATIGQNAFASCYSLTSVVIPASVTTIENGAFYNCCSLTSVVVDGGFEYVNSTIFSNCSSCGVFDFSNYQEVPFLINANAFSNVDASAKIIVPDALYEGWIVEPNWSDLAYQIVKASEA